MFLLPFFYAMFLVMLSLCFSYYRMYIQRRYDILYWQKATVLFSQFFLFTYYLLVVSSTRMYKFLSFFCPFIFYLNLYFDSSVCQKDRRANVFHLTANEPTSNAFWNEIKLMEIYYGGDFSIFFYYYFIFFPEFSRIENRQRKLHRKREQRKIRKKYVS